MTSEKHLRKELAKLRAVAREVVDAYDKVDPSLHHTVGRLRRALDESRSVLSESGEP